MSGGQAPWLGALGALALLVGCSSGGGRGDDGASLGQPVAPTPVTAPDLPAEAPPGTGVVVVGGSVSSFAVTSCELSPGVDDASVLLLVLGEGTTGSGIPFRVEVQRRSTSTAVETYTDTVTYTDTARILQLQRLEVAGEVSDLRDADARGTLLRVRPTGVATRGLAGPPGSEVGDDGIVGLAIDATCS